MSNLLDSIGFLISQYPALKYLFLTGGMIIQGELAILIFVYLILNQTISWTDFLIGGLLGLFLAENLFFLLARLIRKTRFGWRIYRKLKPKKHLNIYFYYLKKHLSKLFILAKFLPGTNLMLLFFAGWLKTKFTQFLKSYLTGLLIWFSTMTLISYSVGSGLYYLKTSKIFHQIEIIIIFILLIILIFEFSAKRIIDKLLKIQEKIKDFEELFEEELGQKLEKLEK